MLLVCEGAPNRKAAEDRLSYLGVPLDFETPYCILVLQLKDMWRVFTDMHERQRFLVSIDFQSRCKEILVRYNSQVIFENHLGEYVMFLNTRSNSYEELLLSVAEELQHLVRNHYEYDCRIGISNRFKGLEFAHTAFESAVNAIQKRYYFDETRAVSVDKYEESVTLRNAQEWAEREICDALMSGDLQRIREKVKTLYEKLEALASAVDQQNFMLYLLFLPTRVLSNVRMGEKGAYDDHRELVERFLYCGDLREQKLLLLKIYEETAEIINTRSEGRAIVRIEEEIELTKTYVGIMQKRFEGVFEAEYYIDPDAANALIPKLSMQPLL